MKVTSRGLGSILLVIAALPLHAETVVIGGRGGGTGQGWLFGSPVDGRCHLALPAHLLQSRPGGELNAGTWRRGDGSEGRLIAPRRPPPPFDDDALDLAFAQVDGVPADGCLSRLGLLDASRTIGRSTAAVVLRRHASYGATMAFTLAGFDDRQVQAMPANEPARAAVANVKGLSGTTLRVETRSRGVQPIGLIVRTMEGMAVATRFDLIRRAFLAEPIVDAETGPVESPTTEQALPAPWTLLRANARTDDSSRGIDRLDDDGCWQAAPNEGRRSVDIELEIARAGQLTIAFADDCGGLPDSVHLQRRGRSGWTQVADCPPENGVARCRPSQTAGQRLRLVLVARDGRHIGLESIRVEPQR